MWSVFILLWSGQIFGQTFRATGLIPVLLDSFGSISPASDRRGRALTMITLLSGFVALSTFTRSILLPSPLLPNLASMASRQRPAISSTPPGASPRRSLHRSDHREYSDQSSRCGDRPRLRDALHPPGLRLDLWHLQDPGLPLSGTRKPDSLLDSCRSVISLESSSSRSSGLSITNSR
jgi:hypothetical protein